MGGTCAVGLAVKYPEVFSAFVDIGGDLGPNIGNKYQTIDRLYGGNAAGLRRIRSEHRNPAS